MLVGLAGFKGSGKNTVADILCKHHGYEQAAFADLLKKSAAALFGISEAFWDMHKEDKDYQVCVTYRQVPIKSFTIRQFLQRYGTEAHRNVFGQDFWVDYILETRWMEADRLVISDVRFGNEIDAIYQEHGKSIWIDRPGFTSDGHSSETDLSKLCHTKLINDGTKEDLIGKVAEVVATHGL